MSKATYNLHSAKSPNLVAVSKTDEFRQRFLCTQEESFSLAEFSNFDSQYIQDNIVEKLARQLAPCISQNQLQNIDINNLNGIVFTTETVGDRAVVIVGAGINNNPGFPPTNGGQAQTPTPQVPQVPVPNTPETSPQTPNTQTPSTTSEIEAIFEFNSTIDRDFEAFLSSGDSIEVAVEKIRTTLLARGDLIEVDSIESTSDGGLIWLSKQENIPIVLDPDVYKPDREEQPVSSAAFNSTQQGNDNSLVKSNLSKEMLAQKNVDLQKSLEIIAQNSSSENIIGSKKALVLSPFYWQFNDPRGFYSDSSQDIAAQLSQFGFDVTYKRNNSPLDNNITLEDFKGLEQYGIVYIFTHGENGRLLGDTIDTYYKINPEEYRKLDGSISQNEPITSPTKRRIRYLFNLSIKSSVIINHRFIEKFSDNMPSSLIYINGCKTLKEGNIAQAFLNKGAGAYLGNSDYSFAFITKGISKTVIDELLHGEVVGGISPLYQAQEERFLGSFLDFRGNGGLKIVKNEILPTNTTTDTEKTVEFQATFPNPTGSSSTQRNLLQWSADKGTFSPDVQYDCSAETQCSGTVIYTAPKDEGEYKIKYSHVADSKITAEASVKVGVSNKCKVYTVPKDPNPNQEYVIKIEMPILPGTSVYQISGAIISEYVGPSGEIFSNSERFNTRNTSFEHDLSIIDNIATLSIDKKSLEVKESSVVSQELIMYSDPSECGWTRRYQKLF